MPENSFEEQEISVRHEKEEGPLWGAPVTRPVGVLDMTRSRVATIFKNISNGMVAKNTNIVTSPKSMELEQKVCNQTGSYILNLILLYTSVDGIK